MKLFKWGLIILIIITICNVITWRFLDYKIAELKAERNRIIHSNWEILKTGGLDDIFDYIQYRNPKISARELAEYVSYVYQLEDDYRSAKYPVTVWEIFEISDIESEFVLTAKGSAGERGPMQITPGTWQLIYKRFGFREIDFENWYCNMAAATYFYSRLKIQYQGDNERSIGFYNGGYSWESKLMTQNHILKYKRASRGMKRLRGEEI